MFTHVFLGSNDIERSRKFYDAVMGTLGYTNVVPPEAGRLVYAGPTGVFVVSKPYNGERAVPANGATLGFAAADDAAVDAWHAAGIAAGGTSGGEPGPRAAAPNNSRGAYLLDPDGNKICAFHMVH
jgi:catechol 2,3-dioxygenase-like lactoylglutathione lyase family enzyme